MPQLKLGHRPKLVASVLRRVAFGGGWNTRSSSVVGLRHPAEELRVLRPPPKPTRLRTEATNLGGECGHGHGHGRGLRLAYFYARASAPSLGV